MARIIAIANQKGGVAKTTTTYNLGASLGSKGKKVLLIDSDHQGNLSEYLGYVEDEHSVTLTDHYMDIIRDGKVNVDKVKNSIRYNKRANVDYIPSDINLATVEVGLLNSLSRETALKRILKEEVIKEYDYVIIDCLPSLNILLINALCFANDVLIAVRPSKFDVSGMDALLGVVAQVKESLNPKLEVMGILPTIVSSSKNSKEKLSYMNDNYTDLMMKSLISCTTEAAVAADEYRRVRGDIRKQYNQLATEVELYYE